MIDHDGLFKELLENFFQDFMELFFPEISKEIVWDSIIFLGQETFADLKSGKRRVADVVVQAKFKGQDTIFLTHVEHQAQHRTDEDFTYRMLRYFCRLYEKYRNPIALLSYDSPRKQQPDFHRVEFIDGLVLSFQYRLIQLNRLNWRDFVRRENPVASALMAKMNIAKEDRVKVKVECLRLLATLELNPAKMHFLSGFIDTYLRLNTVENKTFKHEIAKIHPPEKENVMKIVTSWMEEGIVLGREENRVEVTQRMLQRKLDISLISDITGFSEDQILEIKEKYTPDKSNGKSLS